MRDGHLAQCVLHGDVSAHACVFLLHLSGDEQNSDRVHACAVIIRRGIRNKTGFAGKQCARKTQMKTSFVINYHSKEKCIS